MPRQMGSHTRACDQPGSNSLGQHLPPTAVQGSPHLQQEEGQGQGGSLGSQAAHHARLLHRSQGSAGPDRAALSPCLRSTRHRWPTELRHRRIADELAKGRMHGWRCAGPAPPPFSESAAMRPSISPSRPRAHHAPLVPAAAWRGRGGVRAGTAVACQRLQQGAQGGQQRAQGAFAPELLQLSSCILSAAGLLPD
jgi:hypothetical protein